MKHEQQLELEERLNRACLVWDSPPKMATEGMEDPTRVKVMPKRPSHPGHLHQTGQLHRSSPVHTFGH
ncbi:hypothetical protein JXB37_03785 [candidate division WOR-3 bacterium]|nr:hypothetical protein [candidate division WOR-3 bacterium]